MAKAKKKQKSSTLKEAFFGIVFSARGFPLFFSFFIISILFVLFRMRGVEQSYQISELNKKNEKILYQIKELKGEKAKHLSAKNLRRIARKFDLKEPKADQIIIIP